MKATIKFKTIKQAEDFSIKYSRKTLKGTVVLGTEVSVHNLSDDEVYFINSYVDQLNK